MLKQVAINRPSTQSVSVYVLSSHFSRRLARGHASKGHTGGRSRKIAQPAGLALVIFQKRTQPLLYTSIVKSDFVYNELIVLHLFRPWPIQVALMKVNMFTNV